MKGKGLTMEVIVEAASSLVQEKGYNNFSVRELAQTLEVKAASLYNHISSVADINREVGIHAAEAMNETLEKAAEGRSRGEALESLAYEYRKFAKNNYELYRAIIGLPGLEQGEEVSFVGRESIRVIRRIVHQYEISDEDAIHFSRCYRGALHGFVSLEMAGYFRGKDGKAKSLQSEESFRFMVKGYVDWAANLERMAKEKIEA